MVYAPPVQSSEGARRPSLHDVARLAGCSYQTVSRVLNESAHVSPVTRERVLAAIAETGYRRNGAARALVTSRAGAIGVVSDGSWRYGPIGALHGVEEAARRAGYSVLLQVTPRDSFGSLASTLETFADAFVDGIVVIAPLRGEAALTREVAESFSWARGLPIVLLAPDPTPSQGVRVVSEDQRLGARLATRHLVRLGHRRIVHLAGNQDWLDGSVRLEGWRDELLAHGLEAPEPIYGKWTGQSGYDAGRKLLRQGLPDAVFAASDLMALGMMRAFADEGVRVPDDISVVGFDDHEFSSQFIPPLTTVRQDFRALGRRCLEVLLNEAADQALLEPIRPRLVVRHSTRRADAAL
ncbi:MAG TPA: LacI family transcriptional regulator [Propionibacteriaceae bacterium]|nr:LacI family DNA-binding transcriptional regulator [Micropruina sp.]HBX79657.1 LacI family transcriptional regulator [Propionibacteriaceae bacterium]HBY23721.1 LacI family transcriptional regulator [Propionibacteriaceae bacterium]